MVILFGIPNTDGRSIFSELILFILFMLNAPINWTIKGMFCGVVLICLSFNLRLGASLFLKIKHCKGHSSKETKDNRQRLLMC